MQLGLRILRCHLDGFSLQRRVEEDSLNSRRFREHYVAAVYWIPCAVAWVPLVKVRVSHSQPGFPNQHGCSLEVCFELLA